MDVQNLIDIETAVIISGALLLWVAVVQFVMAAGSRSGELVWSARQPRRLDPSLRARSLVYGLLLLASVWILASDAGIGNVAGVPSRWSMSADFVVMAFLGLTTIYHLGWGSTWERFLFAPITLLGALLAGWFLFS